MSDKYKFKIDQEVKVILKESYQRVLKLLNENRKILDSLATELVEKETMSADEVKKLLKN